MIYFGIFNVVQMDDLILKDPRMLGNVTFIIDIRCQIKVMGFCMTIAFAAVAYNRSPTLSCNFEHRIVTIIHHYHLCEVVS